MAGEGEVADALELCVADMKKEEKAKWEELSPGLAVG